MENLVNFRADQHVTSDDLNNIELYAQGTFTDLINDAVDSGRKYAGLVVTQNGPTGVTVAPGRYYAAGQVYGLSTPTNISISSGLPAVTSKIATLTVWGIQQQTNVQPRAFIINADTGQFQPQTVAMETSFTVQMAIVFGVESSAPTRGLIDSGVITVADILLSPSGIVSITMDQTTMLSSTQDNDMNISALLQWQSSVASQINTIKTDMAIIKQSIPPDLSTSFLALANLVQQIWTIVNKPATAVWTACQRFINTLDTQTALGGYAAIVSDGLRFPAGSQHLTGISLLNPTDPGIMKMGDLILPVCGFVARHQFLPPPSPNISITTVSSQTTVTTNTQTVSTNTTVWTEWIGWWTWGWNPTYTKSIQTNSQTSVQQNQQTSTFTLAVPIVYNLWIATFPVVTAAWNKRHHRRMSIRYGDFVTSGLTVQPDGTIINGVVASNVVSNQASAAGLAEINRRPALTYYQSNRAGGEPYTVDWPNFWAKCNTTLLFSDRNSGCWVDYYDDPYWDAVYNTGSTSGSCMAHVFLNQSNGWMTHIQFWPTSLGGSGDIQCYVCEVDGSYAPRLDRVISQMTIPYGGLTGGPQGTVAPIVPCFLAGGTYYAIVFQSTGNHAFYSFQAVLQSQNNVFLETVLWNYTSNGWVCPAGTGQTPMAYIIYMAQFWNTRQTIQMTAGQLAAGISSLRIMHAGYAPPGTSISWQVQVGGKWIPLDANDLGALNSLPTYLPIQAVLSGTQDCMPVLDLTEAELELDQVATAMVYYSAVRTVTATTTIKLNCFISQWDAAHHTFTAKIHVGGTTYSSPSVVDTPDPTDPTKLQRLFSFTVTSTTSFYYELDATTASGYGFPLANQVWDYTYVLAGLLIGAGAILGALAQFGNWLAWRLKSFMENLHGRDR